MIQLFANNAKSSLVTSITTTTTTLVLSPGDGSKFPNPGANQYFLVTLDSGGVVEICQCTARVGDTLTVTRAYEGTNANNYGPGTIVDCRVTAGTLAQFLKASNSLADITTVDNLLAPLNSEAHSYICHNNDDFGYPIVAFRSTDYKWGFSTHRRILVSGTATSAASTSITSAGVGSLLGAPSAGKYIIQFLTGTNAGTARMVSTSSSGTVTWSTPYTVPPAVGDSFEIYKSDASSVRDLELTAANAIAFPIVFG